MSLNKLQTDIQIHFPQWFSDSFNRERINALPIAVQHSLARLIDSELRDLPTYYKRDECLTDLNHFDMKLNQIASELLALRVGSEDVPIIAAPSDASFFDVVPTKESQDATADQLLRTGYSLSPIALTTKQLTLLKAGLQTRKFRTKGPSPQTLTGAELLAYEGAGGSPSTSDGDTYWLLDMDELTHDELFMRVAFDPYIVSMATRYLGCTPIHVQTNAWFSFPGKTSKNNLSMNGQMFHQDKEFIKFFKVFVYLSDVGPEQGPHSYIEGSQHDELHRKGVGLSERVSDADIGKYYDSRRIKTVTGSAGAILFGDTSCVHKGETVKSGMRIMLQLEYASSLYLSPVSPFSDFQEKLGIMRGYPEGVSKRLTANYDSLLREDYQRYENRRSRPNLKTRLMTVGSTLKRALLG